MLLYSLDICESKNINFDRIYVFYRLKIKRWSNNKNQKVNGGSQIDVCLNKTVREAGIKVIDKLNFSIK